MIMLPIAQAFISGYIDVEIRSNAGILRYRVFDRESTRTEITNRLGLAVSLFGSNQVVRLLCNTNVSASELTQTIADIQESGVHMIILMIQGVKNGTNGIYQIDMNCSKWPYEDQLLELHSGFNATSGDKFWDRKVLFYLQQLSSMTNESQQSVVPLPRVPQTGHSEGEH